MATKSRLQTAVELVAAAVAVGVIGIVAWMLLGRYVPTVEPMQPAATKPPSGGSRVSKLPRPNVRSVAEIPQHYPALDQIFIVQPHAPVAATANGPQIDVKNITIRHLNAYIEGTLQGLAVSPDKKHAIVVEVTPAGTQRAAVWNLEQGKIERFLAAETGKKTKPYAGKENDDFGISVDFRGLANGVFSPNGERFATLRSLQPHSTVLIWEVGTGELLTAYEEPHSIQRELSFASNEEVLAVLKLSDRESSLIAINATDGSARVVRANKVALVDLRVAAQQEIVVIVEEHGLSTVALNGQGYRMLNVPVQAPAVEGVPASTKRVRYFRTWLNESGSQLEGVSNESCDAYDCQTGDLVTSIPFEVQNQAPASFVATGPHLLVRMGFNSGVEWIDLLTGKTVGRMDVPLNEAALVGASDDARCIFLKTDERTLVMIELPPGRPPANLRLSELLAGNKLASTR